MRHPNLLRAALVAAPLLLWAGPAHAQYADPDGPVAVEDTSLAFGQSVRVSGAGFDELTPVDVFLFSDPVKLATVTTDGNGAFSVSVDIPVGTPAGAHTIQAVGVDPAGAPRVLSAAVTVSATGAPAQSGGTGGSSLPRTGIAVGSLVLTGTGLVAVGVATNRRSRRA